MFRNAIPVIAALIAMAWGGTAQGVEVSAGKDGFKISDGDNFSLETHVVVQVSAQRLDDEFKFTGPLYSWINRRIELENRKDTRIEPLRQFDIYRARVIFTGHFAKPWLRFKMAAESGVENSASHLRDAYIQIGNPKSFWFRLGQFRPVFGLFKQAEEWKLHFRDEPLSSVSGPDYDSGFQIGWNDKANHWRLRLAAQNGDGLNALDSNDGKLVTALAEYSNVDSEYDDLTAAEHPETFEYRVGASLMHDQVGSLVDAATGGFCILGSSERCRYEDDTIKAWELFATGRTRRVSGAFSYWESTAEKAGQADLAGNMKDIKRTAFDVDLGFFVTDKVELVARYSRVTTKDQYLTPLPFGPDALTDEELVASPRPNLVRFEDRYSQAAFGFNWYLQEQHMKVSFDWTTNEDRFLVRDIFMSYVPDLGHGFPPVDPIDQRRRDGRINRQRGVWTATVTFWL